MLWRNQPIIANNPSKGGANATLHCTGPSAIQNLPIRIHPAIKIRHADQKLTQVFRFQQTGSLPVSLAYPKVAHPHSPWQWLLSPMTTTPKPPRWASLKFNRPKRTTGETIWGWFESWGLAPQTLCISVFQKNQPIQTKQNKTSLFYCVGNPCLWVRHHKYTLENPHGTQKYGGLVQIIFLFNWLIYRFKSHSFWVQWFDNWFMIQNFGSTFILIHPLGILKLTVNPNFSHMFDSERLMAPFSSTQLPSHISLQVEL